MRFPLSMTAGMASYIARNKIRPNPEWQKNVVAAPTLPIRSGSSTPITDAAPQTASHDQQALSAGADAGAAAYLQSHLHRMRAHPRIRIHHHAEACRCEQCLNAVRRVRRAHRFHLRRRADAVSRDRPAGRETGGARTRPFTCAPTACSFEKRLKEFKPRRQILLQRPPGRHGEKSRHRRRARGRFPRSHRGRQAGQAGRLPGLAPTPRSTKRPT